MSTQRTIFTRHSIDQDENVFGLKMARFQKEETLNAFLGVLHLCSIVVKSYSTHSHTDRNQHACFEHCVWYEIPREIKNNWIELRAGDMLLPGDVYFTKMNGQVDLFDVAAYRFGTKIEEKCSHNYMRPISVNVDSIGYLNINYLYPEVGQSIEPTDEYYNGAWATTDRPGTKVLPHQLGRYRRITFEETQIKSL
ncbi:hypothetical protein EBT16_05865 [bacterium]|nr:hypothetical protein [bacterium]